MRTLGKLLRRYMLLGVGITLLVIAANIAIYVGIVLFNYEKWCDQATSYYVQQIGEGFVQEADGTLHPGPGHTLEDWTGGWAWGMMLDDAGQVVWRYELPAELDHPYTVREVAAFTRWYLDDWPVFSYVTGYGLLVMAMPRGSIWRSNTYFNSELFGEYLSGVPKAILADLLIVLALCLIMAVRLYRGLRSVEQGIESLARGEPAQVPERGLTAELAGKLNQTGAHLRRQSELIARRDSARTEWIAGVSHDIRTPLALIFGYAEQLEGDAALPPEARQRGAAIRAQGQKIRALIEDLNLTSKLQYNAQPLRRAPTPAGPFLRRVVTDFCNASACPVDFTLTPAAGHALLDADAALLTRALENLLNNSDRHNPGGCTVTVQADAEDGRLQLVVADDGAGYPPAVLAVLQGGEVGENSPHILGLHVVCQIIAAHGGTVAFAQNTPHGARAAITLPCLPPDGEK